MNTQDYAGLFKGLMERCGLLEKNIIFVESVSAWCEDYGIPEPDKQKPLKLIRKEKSGCLMLICENISEKVIEERINAMSIRNQVENVAFDVTDKLDSPEKRLAYLFLSEYALSLPDIDDDERFADKWAFSEMERRGFFKK
jgi:hypothetical protein